MKNLLTVNGEPHIKELWLGKRICTSRKMTECEDLMSATEGKMESGGHCMDPKICSLCGFFRKNVCYEPRCVEASRWFPPEGEDVMEGMFYVVQRLQTLSLDSDILSPEVCTLLNVLDRCVKNTEFVNKKE